MSKRILKIIYFIALAIELFFCYKWLIQPVAPVVLQLLKGTFQVTPGLDIYTASTNLFKVIIQAFAFAFLIIGTTKIYKHFYESLPNDTNSDDSDS